MTIEDRGEFERRGYCSHCGRRLIYSQYEETHPALHQGLVKVCPIYQRDSAHDYLPFDQPRPARDRRGHLTGGSKRVLRDLAARGG